MLALGAGGQCQDRHDQEGDQCENEQLSVWTTKARVTHGDALPWLDAFTSWSTRWKQGCVLRLDGRLSLHYDPQGPLQHFAIARSTQNCRAGSVLRTLPATRFSARSETPASHSTGVMHAGLRSKRVVGARHGRAVLRWTERDGSCLLSPLRLSRNWRRAPTGSKSPGWGRPASAHPWRPPTSTTASGCCPLDPLGAAAVRRGRRDTAIVRARGAPGAHLLRSPRPALRHRHLRRAVPRPQRRDPRRRAEPEPSLRRADGAGVPLRLRGTRRPRSSAGGADAGHGGEHPSAGGDHPRVLAWPGARPRDRRHARAAGRGHPVRHRRRRHAARRTGHRRGGRGAVGGRSA